MHKILFLLLLILLFLQPSCRQNDFSTPPKFEGDNNNPILTPGEPGSWDELFVSAPQVVFFKNTFYLFYMGGNEAGQMAVGLATSYDGFNFTKFTGNPLLAPDGTGFDAFTLGPGIVLKDDTTWVMYYNGQELAGYAPGASVGRATAKQLTGPWIRNNTPVLTSGKKGEWDDGFILPCSVMKLENGSYRIYYTGGREISGWKDFFIGMAESTDGINWKKYNDPSTTEHPFRESDPVFQSGNPGEWDEKSVWMANITKQSSGFRMYYAGSKGEGEAIGYAHSRDGIHWERYNRNPVFDVKGDPGIHYTDEIVAASNPFFLRLDTICFLYYYFEIDTPSGGNIRVATGN